MKPNDHAKAVIDSIPYMTLATVSDTGEPWNTPVAHYHFDNDYGLYWASWTDNQHSRNIRDNGKVFIVIYDSTPTGNMPTQGVYIQAEAKELTDPPEVMQAAAVFKDDPYNPHDGMEFLGNKPRRIYKAVPKKIWLNTDSEVNGNFVDIRVEADEKGVS